MSSTKRLPLFLPARHENLPGQSSFTDLDTGGYDFSIGGFGFRLATDQNDPYIRGTEPTTVHRFDTETEPGEQSLSPLPWIKSQSSFHGGAGQRNLEHGRNTFEYQQEQIDHVRFELSQGIDPWATGTVKRLPDTEFSNVFVGGEQLAIGPNDAFVVMGTAFCKRGTWSHSKADDFANLTTVDVDLSAVGGVSNVASVDGFCSDGANFYAAVTTTVAVGGHTTFIIRAPIAAGAAVIMYAGVGTGRLGFVKARLIAQIAPSVYQLDLSAAAAVVLPAPNYTYPSPPGTTIVGGPISEAPDGVLVAWNPIAGPNQIIKLTLDSTGGTPTLSGGAVVGQLPPGESLNAMFNYLGAYLVLCTTAGLRVCTFDSFSGNPQLGPLTLTADTGVGLNLSNVLALAGRDRFIYAASKAGQPDGQTGLTCVDLSLHVDTIGRLAWAPSLRPPPTAPVDASTPKAVAIFSVANRMAWLTAQGLYFESTAGPGSNGDAWLRTSRIRYDTAEPKLFKLGRIHGTLDQGDIQVVGLAPYATSKNLGTFRVLPGQDDPGEFRLPTGINEWIQLEFHLLASASELSSYQTKAYPAPSRQHIIQLTANCFTNETDRYGLDVTDPQSPRQRFLNIKDLEAAGNEVRFVEFTNSGAVASVVVIDQIQFQSTVRPNIDDDFGGRITFRLRETEG